MTANTAAAPADGLVLTPLSAECAAALARAEHACIGISPFNSYFSVGRIRQIAELAYRHFVRVDFAGAHDPAGVPSGEVEYAQAPEPGEEQEGGHHPAHTPPGAPNG